MPIIGKLIGGLDFSSYFIMLSSPPPDFKGPMTYEALTKFGVPLFAYGNFITVALNFMILAFIIFQMVKMMNRMKRAQPAPAAVSSRRVRACAREVHRGRGSPPSTLRPPRCRPPCATGRPLCSAR